MSQNRRSEPHDPDPEQDLVDAGSEYSFPASDPPSYMAGTAVAGAPPDDTVRRGGVSTKLVDPGEGKPAGDAPSGTGPAKAGQTPDHPPSGRNDP